MTGPSDSIDLPDRARATPCGHRLPPRRPFGPDAMPLLDVVGSLVPLHVHVQWNGLRNTALCAPAAGCNDAATSASLPSPRRQWAGGLGSPGRAESVSARMAGSAPGDGILPRTTKGAVSASLML